MIGNQSYLNNYCQQKVAPRGSNIYYSLLYTPLPQRQAIIAVRAFLQELSEIGIKCRDPIVAQAKLTWWQHEVAQLFAGVPSHPVTQAIKQAMQFINLPRACFEEIIAGFNTDLSASLYQTSADILHFYHHTAGATERLVGFIQDIHDEKILSALNSLGIFVQSVKHLRNSCLNIKSERCYIPAEILLKHQVTLKQLNNLQLSEAIRNLFSEQAMLSQQYYQQAKIILAPTLHKKALLPSLILAELNAKLLDEIIAADYPVLQQRISLTPLRKLWTAWRTAWI